MGNTSKEQAPGAVNSDPIDSLRRLVRDHRPALATPEQGSRADYVAWTREVRQKVFELLGLSRMGSAGASTARFAQSREDGIKRERLYIETEPGYWAPVIVNIPDGQGPFPLVLCLHGHCNNGKEGVSGLIAEIPGLGREALEEESAHYRDTYGADLVKMGFLTVSLDNRDFDEAIHPEPYTYNDYGWHVAHIAWQNALGRSYVGCAIWDAKQVLEYALRRDDVDTGRVGCIGFSLGGLLTLYLTLLEPRIKAAVVSGYFDSFLQRIVRGRGADCLCNYIPGLFAWFDIPDVMAALAPRPLLCNIEGFGHETLFARVQRVYDALDAGDRCELFQFEAPYHMFSGERAYPWLLERLRPEATSLQTHHTGEPKIR